MLHAGVGTLHQLVAILIEGILAEILFIRRHHRFRLLELLPRLFKILRQHVVIERQILSVRADVLIFEVRVLPDIECDAIIINRTTYAPIVTRPAVGKHRSPLQPSVGNFIQAGRNRDADGHGVRLGRCVVLVRPPNAGADFRARHHYPRIAFVVMIPTDSPVPGGTLRDLRRAGIEYRHRMGAVRQGFRGKFYKHGVQFAGESRRCPLVKNDFADRQIAPEINLHFREIIHDFEGDLIRPFQ